MSAQQVSPRSLPPGAGAGPRRHGDRLSRRGDEPRALVALKVIAPDLATDPEFRARFEREARTAAGLDHPNVVPVRRGEAEPLPFSMSTWRHRPQGAAQGARQARIRRRPRSRRRWRPPSTRPTRAASSTATSSRGTSCWRRPRRAAITPTSPTSASRRTRATRPSASQTGQWVGTVDYISPEQVSGRPIDAWRRLLAGVRAVPGAHRPPPTRALTSTRSTRCQSRRPRWTARPRPWGPPSTRDPAAMAGAGPALSVGGRPRAPARPHAGS